MDARERSFWGWGYADRFPDPAARSGLAALAGSLLGGAQLELQPAPRLEAVSLPPPRLDVPAALAGFCAAAARDRVLHTYGKSYRDLVRGFRGDFAPAPDFVAYPRSEEEIDAVLAYCRDRGAAAIPFGGGTSVVGGVEADVGDGYAGAVSIDLRHFDRVLEIDPVSQAARIQAGATGPRLEAELARAGLTLRHYPQSFEFSTLGGWLATRSGGHFATGRTHIDDFVESIRTVTPRGVLESRRLPGSGAGPSPDRLLLGSEGTLGVITEAWMRVMPRPRRRASASVRFGDFDRAVAAVRAIAQSGLWPSNCRLLDAREAMLHRVPSGGGPVVLIGFESADRPLSAAMDSALAIAAACGGTCPDGPRYDDRDAAAPERAGAAAAWRSAFLDAPYLFNALVSVGVVVDTFETACTWDRFDELHAAVIAATRAAMKRACGAGFLSCRFSHVYPDGPAPYYTFLAPARRGGELEQWGEIKRAASDALLAHGATITHHHAVGRVHRPWYDRQRPALFAAALSAAKRALDPAAILNPGVLIDPSDPAREQARDTPRAREETDAD